MSDLTPSRSDTITLTSSFDELEQPRENRPTSRPCPRSSLRICELRLRRRCRLRRCVGHPAKVTAGVRLRHSKAAGRDYNDSVRLPTERHVWSKSNDPATGKTSFEMLDGQQRSMSICEYIEGAFSVVVDGNPKNFDNLSAVDQERLRDYRLMVYHCEGNENEQLAWLRSSTSRD